MLFLGGKYLNLNLRFNYQNICIFITRYCDIHDYSCIVYDHEGMGESALLEGTDRTKVLFSHWVEDAVAVVEELADGPIVFASCSLGGWLSIVAAQQLKHRLHGMVMI